MLPFTAVCRGLALAVAVTLTEIATQIVTVINLPLDEPTIVLLNDYELVSHQALSIAVTR
jgi:hypothetical protein